MTTIVYDHKNKEIAVDSKSTMRGIAVNINSIKYVYRNSELFFICGKFSDYGMLIDYSIGDKSKYNGVMPEATAIKVSNGKVYLCDVNNDGVCDETLINFNLSIGSGELLALAALDFGKSAKEAVEYAATRDIYTGGKVHVFDVETMKFIEPIETM